ncbi:hypothetical protein DYB32_000602 [Aphanomyces invadans]|uniref:RecQ-mediated genome instability protein 1 C-terminal OB-fold domain-containing protein n=1 Tax=Aphanomyces invadans TaxID=157072 RepID=A0A3R6VHZ8_9STRA|nr:hypothetical protein DYB32_000602 [Aphanomyces invadans]
MNEHGDQIELATAPYKLKILGYYHRKIDHFLGHFPRGTTDVDINRHYNIRTGITALLFFAAFVVSTVLLAHTEGDDYSQVLILYVLSVASVCVLFYLGKLSAKTPRGTKIVIENVAVRHGLLMLTSAVVLGASGNDALEAAIVNPLPPVTMPTPTPAKPWDADLSDEERSTDPSIRHLFYEPPRLATSSARPRATSSAPSSTSSLKAAADPMTPFTYLSTVNVASASRVIVKGFVKSVVSFQFQTGVYQLKVYVEDATRAVLVDVDPVVIVLPIDTVDDVLRQFVQQLMGVPCATFVHAMQANTPQGMQWVATMQHKLSVLEGRLTIDFTSAACQVENPCGFQLTRRCCSPPLYRVKMQRSQRHRRF